MKKASLVMHYLKLYLSFLLTSMARVFKEPSLKLFSYIEVRLQYFAVSLARQAEAGLDMGEETVAKQFSSKGTGCFF